MSKTRIAISNQDSRGMQQAKYVKKLRDIRDLKRIDAIAVQQHVIRRLKSRHRSHYDNLIGLRTELDKFLATKGLEIARNESTDIPRPKMLASIMNFCWSKKNVEILLTGECTHINQNLETHILDFVNSGFRCPVITSSDLPQLTEILVRYSIGIIEMHNRLNYFSYYSPYGLTSEVSGEKLYGHYVRAKTGYDLISLRSLFPMQAISSQSHIEVFNTDESEDVPHREARWLYTDETACDADLAALVETRCYLPSSQVGAKIFAGWKNEILIDGIEINDHLVLAIPASRFPIQIDSIMEEFREALLFELISRTTFDDDSAENISSFYESAFANTLSHRPCLISSFEGIRMIFLGLWAWDLVHLNKETPDNASRAVHTGIEMLKLDLGKPQGILIPDPDSIKKNGYEKVVANAGPAAGQQKKKRSSRIDKYLTCSRHIVLGDVG